MSMLLNRCAYCGEEGADTREHVIPQRWAPEGTSFKTPIIVSACKACNHEKSKTDEWLRKWFVTMVGDKSQEAEQVLNSSVARSIQRLPALGREVIQKMKLVDLYDKETGKYAGRRTLIHMTDDYWERVMPWMKDITKGLYTWDTGRILDRCAEIQCFFASDEEFEGFPLLETLIPHIPYPERWHVDDAMIFSFGRNYTVEGDRSVWIITFYNRIAFISFIGPRDWIEEMRKEHGEQKPQESEILKKFRIVEVGS